MENILLKVQEILDSPEKLKEFQNLASTILNDNDKENQLDKNEISTNQVQNFEKTLNNNNNNIELKDIENILKNFVGSGEIENRKKNNTDQFDMPLNLNVILKLKDIAQIINQDDKNIEFLKALKLLLGNEKQQKIDDAIKVIRLFKLIPIIKDTGILKDFLF